VTPWVFQSAGWRSQVCSVSPRGLSGVGFTEISRDVHISEGVGSPNRSAAIALHIPSESCPRSKMQPLRVDAVVWKSRVAGVVQARRRIHEHGALDTLTEPVVIEIEDRLRPLRNEGLPADTVIQCQSGRGFPAVCCEYAES